MRGQEKPQRVPKSIARAMLCCLARLPHTEPAAGRKLYCALHIAAHLSSHGIAVRIDEKSHHMVLGEAIVLPLYTRHEVRSNGGSAEKTFSPNTLLHFSVLGEDLAAVAYRYCFGTPPEAVVAAKPTGACEPYWRVLRRPFMTGVAALCAFCRLVVLLLPSPQEMLIRLLERTSDKQLR